MKNTRFLFASIIGTALIGAATVSAQIGTKPASGDVPPGMKATAATETSNAATTDAAEPAPTPIALQPRMANSAGELQQMINLPTTATLKESEEDPTKPKSIFGDKDISKIFGTRFVYYPEGVDPMIIPWVRERIVAEEKFAEAQVAESNKDWTKARVLLKQIRELYPTTDEANKVPDELAKIDKMEAAANPGPHDKGDPNPPQGEATLPKWISDNTTGVIIQKNPIVVVGNDFLKVGDPVPRFSSVHVKKITASEVVYEYQDKEFAVPVVGSF